MSRIMRGKEPPAKKGSTKQQPKGRAVPPPAKPQRQIPANNNVPALASAVKSSIFEEDAGSGMEGMSQENFAIPRLAILQSLSPQLDKKNDAYIPEAEAGMIYDSVSDTLYNGEDGILVALISFRHSYLNWWPRNSRAGKGFIRDFGNDPTFFQKTKRNDLGQNLLADGSEVIPTAEYFAFIINEEDLSISRVLIPMAKTQYKKSKKLNSMSQIMIPLENGRKVPAALFFRTYRLTTVPESNDKGSWYGWKIEPGPALVDNPLGIEVLEGGETIYMEARAFKASVVKNEVKVAAPVEDLQHQPSGGGGAGADDDDSPM